LAGWKRSGLSMAAYAGRRGYPAHRLTWWKKRLKEEVDTRGQGSGSVVLAPAVVTGTVREQAAVTVAVTGGSVRIVVEDPSAVGPDWIGRLVAEVRGQREGIS